MWWQYYSPTPYIFHIGPININWYGLIMVLAIVVAGFLSRKKLNQDHVINYRQFEDLFFYAVVFGLLGARIGHVLFEFDYYLLRPQDIVKIWQGGLSLYGSLLGGVLAVWYWAKKRKINFFYISDRVLPFFALAQAIGRWGNYFNQELFGKATDAWWGIYIAPENRPPLFYNQSHYHPTFFYESVLDLSLFIFLFLLSKKNPKTKIITFSYLAFYALIRFFMEFVRIDDTKIILGLRVPQFVSLVVFLAAVIVLLSLRTRSLSNSKK